jgi:hypothetical protein
MMSERDWEKYERTAEKRRVGSEADARRKRLEEASSLGRKSRSGAGLWLVGMGVVVGGLLLFHGSASAAELTDKPRDKPRGRPASPRAPGPGSTPAAHAAHTSSFPVGTHVEAQDHDGKWYGATVRSLNLADPNAVRWDAGTPGAARNPRTGSSPASAVRAG